jgi:hypothetical protein
MSTANRFTQNGRRLRFPCVMIAAVTVANLAHAGVPRPTRIILTMATSTPESSSQRNAETSDPADEAPSKPPPEKNESPGDGTPAAKPPVNDEHVLETLGAPDFDLLERLEKGPVKDVESRLVLVRSGRLAALRKRAVTAQTMYEVGVRNEVTNRPTTIADVLQARSDLVQAELEHSTNALSRLTALRSQRTACAAGEIEVRAKHAVGARGGSSAELYAAVAWRLQSDERILRELLDSKKVDASDAASVPQKPDTTPLAVEDARKIFEAVGQPDDQAFESLMQAPRQEILARMNFVRSGRIAALILRRQAVLAEYNAGVSDVNFSDVHSANTELAEAELESLRDPAARAVRYRSMVLTAAVVEDQARTAHEAEGGAGNSRAFYSALAARLLAEDRLAMEILMQLASQEAADVVTKRLASRLVETMEKESADQVLTAVRELDENLMEGFRRMTASEVESRVILVRAGRIWSLRRCLESMAAESRQLGQGASGTTMQAAAELADAEGEYTRLPGSQVGALKVYVIAAGQHENEVRTRRAAQSRGGNNAIYYDALAARLRAEERWLSELRQQR